MSIFESPDQGETIYKREIGSLDRELVSISEKKKSMYEQLKEDQLWGEIRRKAKTNVALNDILNQAIMVYNLIKDEKRN
jgi:hypothetical protein